MINFALKPGGLAPPPAWVADVLGVLHFDEGASFFLGDQPFVVRDGLPRSCKLVSPRRQRPVRTLASSGRRSPHPKLGILTPAVAVEFAQ